MSKRSAGRFRLRVVGVIAVLLILASAIAAISGCGGSQNEPPEPGESPPQIPPATVTAIPPDRASGLLFESGAFAGHDGARAEQFAADRGKPLDVITVFPDRASWEKMKSNWWFSAIPAEHRGTVNVAVPLWPEDGSVRQASTGAYDDHWRQFATMVAARWPDAYIRLGWEMNLDEVFWAATPANQEQWREAFVKASTAMKSVAPAFRIVFNVNEGASQTGLPAESAYPGDEYVDVIALDAYDWSPPYTNEANWKTHRTKVHGWDWWLNFARTRGKPFALPEWGVSSGSDDSGKDNPAYIRYVYNWLAEHAGDIAFEAYYDEPAEFCRCSLSQNPKARKAYAEAMDRVTFG